MSLGSKKHYIGNVSANNVDDAYSINMIFMSNICKFYIN